jgi:hypothetical protein
VELGVLPSITSKHEGQLKRVPAAYGGTVDVDINSTIFKRKARDGDVATLWNNSSHSMAKKKELQLETNSLFLAMDNVPTDVVQSKYFRPTLNSFDSNAAPPSINKVKEQFRVLEENIR